MLFKDRVKAVSLLNKEVVYEDLIPLVSYTTFYFVVFWRESAGFTYGSYKTDLLDFD
jgi:hypothetical protein